MEKITVIIPTYNRSALLEKAIESVLKQSYAVSEILICDDDSTDDSEILVRAITKKDDRVRWLACGKSGRPSIPRNIGIGNSNGDWIAFLDSDDTWHADKIKIQIDQLSGTKLLASCTNALKINEAGILNGTYLIYQNKTIKFKNLIENNWIICSSMIIHKSLIAKTGGFPEDKKFKAIEDYLLWLKVITITDVVFVDKNLVTYLDAPQTSIRSYGINQWQQKIIILQEFGRWIVETKTFSSFILFAIFKNYAKAFCSLFIFNLKVLLIKTEGNFIKNK